VNLDLKRGVALVEELELKIEPLLFDGDLGHVEHMVHEVSHGISLGIPIVKGFEMRVTENINLLDDDGVQEEALTLATEGILFKWLGYPIEQCDLEDAAGIQNVPMIELHEKQRSREATELAHRVLVWLRTQGVVT
jgi:hypothetical protein